MKYVKMLGLAAIAAALMAMVVAGSASATTLTNKAGEFYLAETAINSEAEGTTTLHPPIGDITCSGSSVSGSTANAGGASETVHGPISSLTFTGCNAEVVVIESGSLEIHTKTASADNNGTLTSSGAKVTVTFSGFHCIFTTSNTDIGTLTGSTTTGGGNATLDIEATIPRTGGRSGAFCGTTAQWTGSYKVTTPSFLNVD